MPNESSTAGIIVLTLFFTIEFLVVTYGGAGNYIDPSEIAEAPQPDLTLSWAIESIEYFFGLWLINPGFGIFNAILFVPYTIMLLMYVIGMIRGN